MFQSEEVLTWFYIINNSIGPFWCTKKEHLFLFFFYLTFAVLVVYMHGREGKPAPTCYSLVLTHLIT